MQVAIFSIPLAIPLPYFICCKVESCTGDTHLEVILMYGIMHVVTWRSMKMASVNC